jgi:hypothetical protein
VELGDGFTSSSLLSPIMGVVYFRVGEYQRWRIFRFQRPDMTTRGEGDQLSVGYACVRRSGELDNSNCYVVLRDQGELR